MPTKGGLTPVPVPVHIVIGNIGIPIGVGGNGGILGGGSGGGSGGGINGGGIQVVTQNPTQVVGFVPLTPCDYIECRTFCECPYVNPVFGNSGVVTSTYENDWNTFLVDYSLYNANPSNPPSCTFYLQQKQGNSWVNVVILNNNLYGIFYPFNSFQGHFSYTGFALNWGRVIQFLGEGFYRIMISSSFNRINGCLVSEPFCLRTWNCNLADKTAKFESYLTGKIGFRPLRTGLYDLCGMNWFDSIRVRGMFGFEHSEYQEEWLKYNTGVMELERDEELNKFQFISSPKGFPKWLIDRLKTFGLMADKLLASDYCLNNSDWEVKQLQVINAGGVKPKYRVSSRNSSITIDFADGIQNVIKVKCCPPSQPR